MKIRQTFISAFCLLSWIGVSFCASAAEELQGRIETFALNGSASGMEAEVQVYLPPSYDGEKEPLPVMYFLHGSGGVSGIRILAGFAEEAAGENLCRPFVIVELRGPNTPQCLWVDAVATDSKAGTLVSQDLLQAVESRYRVMKTREGRIIAGFSMGGFGAMAQLFQHPELFATGVAYDGGFPENETTGYGREDLRKWIGRLFGDDNAAFQQATPRGRAAQYAKLPDAQRLPVDYQLLVGAFSNRIGLFQKQLEEIGVARPGRIIGTPTGHKLDKVLESCWREHFRFLEQRLAERTEVPQESYQFRLGHLSGALNRK